jgi:hypothetical protein
MPDSGGKEAHELTITLTGNEDPESFNSIFKYIYTGNVKIKHAEIRGSKKYFIALVNLYMVAHLLMMDDLMNTLMDLAVEHSKNCVHPTSAIEAVYANNLEDLRPVDHLLFVRPREIRLGKEERGFFGVFATRYLEGSPWAIRLFYMVFDDRFSLEAGVDVAKWQVCKWWHVHEISRECGY